MHRWSKFWLSILILNVQRTSMSFKSSFGAFEDAGGSWLEVGILILIWIGSLAFDTPMIQIFALYLDFEGAKKIHVLWVLIQVFGGCWRFLTWVWYLDLDLDMWSLIVPCSKFWLSTLILKMLRTTMSLKSLFWALEDAGFPSWGLVSWSWFG